MLVDKNSAVEDIVVEAIEEIANRFFADEENIIEMIIAGEGDTPIVDMGINYDVFRIMLEEAYEICEERLLDSAPDLMNVSVFIDSMKRETFEISGVNIMIDPYGDISAVFNMENLVEG
jgi:hypothetical protein